MKLTPEEQSEFESLKHVHQGDAGWRRWQELNEKLRKKAIGEFEILDHGIDHSQYFQGCGISYTRFNNVVTGCGSNAKEAFDDAMEQIASAGEFDYKLIEDSEEGKQYQTEEAEAASVENHLKKYGESVGEDCELYYYLSVRWNEEG